jgi:hypothetical protein
MFDWLGSNIRHGGYSFLPNALEEKPGLGPLGLKTDLSSRSPPIAAIDAADISRLKSSEVCIWPLSPTE